MTDAMVEAMTGTMTDMLTDALPTDTSNEVGANRLHTGLSRVGTRPVASIEPWQRQARQAARIAAAVASGVLGFGWLLAELWRSDLPVPVATNFDLSGTPNHYESLNTLLVVALLPGLVFAVLGVVLCWKFGRMAHIRRIMFAVAISFPVFCLLLLLVVLAGQRGLADAGYAQFPTWIIGVNVAAAAAVGLGAALLLPADLPQAALTPLPTGASRVELAPSERAGWVERTRISQWYLLITGAIVVVLVALWAVNGWWALLIPITLIVCTVVGTAFYSVRVDARGVLVRGVMGWPRVIVPASEILHATTDSAHPLDWGGLGWRGMGHEVGVITSAGEALRIERTGSRALVITVNDAATGAALLNTMAERART
ncbi:MAG: hypothetical protein FWG25_03145 [Promicromonosporaceae bacterium]|nr:hypothetical protein [Promicromonosporaceae bacterium]